MTLSDLDRERGPGGINSATAQLYLNFAILVRIFAVFLRKFSSNNHELRGFPYIRSTVRDMIYMIYLDLGHQN